MSNIVDLDARRAKKNESGDQEAGHHFAACENDYNTMFLIRGDGMMVCPLCGEEIDIIDVMDMIKE